MKNGDAALAHVAAFFHQDADVAYSSLQQLLFEAIAGLDREERLVLSRFLSDALANRSDGALEELWRRSGADLIFLGAGQLRAFLGGLKDFVIEND